MKAKILSIVTILFLVFKASTQTFAAVNFTDNNATVLSNIAKINQIEVHGNVELYITSGESDKVKVYNNYYNQNALVQEQNGVLRISSYKAEKLVVWVTVSDLRTLAAYDDSSIKSFGKFSGLDFDMNLSNNATADLDMDCNDAKIMLNNNAKAKIAGFAAQTYMVVNQTAQINTASFTTQKSTLKYIAPVTASTEADEFAFN